MKIAFTHNLQVTAHEDEAEFDTPETVRAISDGLRALGHDVETVEVSVSVPQLVARLDAIQPDLVFNTAEGRYGRTREAFYPALFDQMKLPYTGSDAYACTLSLDKRLSKAVVASHGIPTPRWCFVDSEQAPLPKDLSFPVIVKPNFEGSSKGITERSVCETPEALAAYLDEALKHYPGGLLVEELIVGKDVVVPFLEGASPSTGGVLPAADYVFHRTGPAPRYDIYDFALKHDASSSVEVRAPAAIDDKLASQLRRASQVIFKALGVRDLGRADFRVTDDGRFYFLELNALPSLEPGAALYESAALAGLPRVEDVLRTVVNSALKRQGKLVERRRASPRRTKPVRVGLVFNLKRVSPKATGDDREAEYDSEETVRALSEAIASHGHEVVPIEAKAEVLTHIAEANVDMAFNIAEGIRGRARESIVPAILEMLDIPYTGSDPTTLALTLDKALAKQVVREAGVPTPGFAVLATGKEKLPKDFAFPAIVKPLAEGSSKGVLEKSVVENEAELREAARKIIERYQQAALAETYLSGREFTVGLLGERRPRVLPPMEIVFDKAAGPFPIYTFQHKQDFSSEVRYEAPAKVDARLGREIVKVSRQAFMALGCRDVARIDLRCDAKGRVHFIECNPLPGLTPDWSDLCMIAKAAGMDYRSLVGEIMAPALRRLRRKVKERRGALVSAPVA